MKKTKVFVLLTVTLLFLNCGGAPAAENEEVQFYSYETSEFTILAPDTWQSQNAFTSEFPQELRVAFKNNIREGDFIANVTVIREDNPDQFSNVDFTQKKLQEHKETLLNFEFLKEEELALKIGSDESRAFLTTFTGKNETKAPTLEFMQVSLVKGDSAWTATAAYLPTEDDFVIEQMRNMLESFSLR